MNIIYQAMKSPHLEFFVYFAHMQTLAATVESYQYDKRTEYYRKRFEEFDLFNLTNWRLREKKS